MAGFEGNPEILVHLWYLHGSHFVRFNMRYEIDVGDLMELKNIKIYAITFSVQQNQQFGLDVKMNCVQRFLSQPW